MCQLIQCSVSVKYELTDFNKKNGRHSWNKHKIKLCIKCPLRLKCVLTLPWKINKYLRKARRFGLCSSTCLCDVSEYLRLADCRLFNRIQSSSHCLSHLLPPEKHHLGLRPRGHRYTLPICPNELCKSSFIPRSLFSFLWFFFYLQCFILLYNICVCLK